MTNTTKRWTDRREWEMLERKFNYPGDPELQCWFLFGQEFIDEFRALTGGLGVIQVNDEPPMVFSEIICDLCNAEVGRLEPCLLVHRMLYCWACAADKLQYIS
jgi:hypothetical protein